MAAKKAKSPAPASKPAAKGKAAKAAPKAGAISSLKKMLGIAPAKGAGKPAVGAAKAPVPAKGAKPAPVATKGARGAAKAPVVAAGKKGEAPAPKLTGKAAAAAAKKGAAPAAAPVATGKPGRPPKNAQAPAVERRSAPVVSGPPVCREVACELFSTTGGYCRMHYIKNWKKIKRKQMILQEKKLNSYIEELVSKYPDKYIEAIRQDLASEKDFAKVIADLEIEEGMDDFESVDTESAEGIIESFKKDFDDEGDVF